MADRAHIRIGAAAAVAGGALAVVFGALHAGPRRGNTRLFLEDLADNRIWVLDHLGLAVAFLMLLVALGAVTRMLGGSPWARGAWPMAIVGVATALVGVAVDGPVMKAVADRWASGGDVFATAEVLREVDVAVFTLWTMLLVGVVPVMYGVALLGDASFPPWLGWLAIGGGLLGLVTGVLQWFLGLFRFGVFVLHPAASGALAVWAIALGILLWRKSTD